MNYLSFKAFCKQPGRNLSTSSGSMRMSLSHTQKAVFVATYLYSDCWCIIWNHNCKDLYYGFSSSYLKKV